MLYLVQVWKRLSVFSTKNVLDDLFEERWKCFVLFKMSANHL